MEDSHLVDIHMDHSTNMDWRTVTEDSQTCFQWNSLREERVGWIGEWMNEWSGIGSNWSYIPEGCDEHALLSSYLLSWSFDQQERCARCLSPPLSLCHRSSMVDQSPACIWSSIFSAYTVCHHAQVEKKQEEEEASLLMIKLSAGAQSGTNEQFSRDQCRICQCLSWRLLDLRRSTRRINPSWPTMLMMMMMMSTQLDR